MLRTPARAGPRRGRARRAPPPLNLYHNWNAWLPNAGTGLSGRLTRISGRPRVLAPPHRYSNVFYFTDSYGISATCIVSCCRERVAWRGAARHCPPAPPAHTLFTRCHQVRTLHPGSQKFACAWPCARGEHSLTRRRRLRLLATPLWCPNCLHVAPPLILSTTYIFAAHHHGAQVHAVLQHITGQSISCRCAPKPPRNYHYILHCLCTIHDVSKPWALCRSNQANGQFALASSTNSS